jgi:hypothetical protein
MAVRPARLSVEETIAGFAEWLSQKHWPAARVRRYSDLMRQFLYWQCDQRGLHSSDCTEDAYCLRLPQHGATPPQVAEVRMALDLFRDCRTDLSERATPGYQRAG